MQGTGAAIAGVFEAWKALRAAEEQQHSEAPHRHTEEVEPAVLKSQNDSETHTSSTEPIESLSVTTKTTARSHLRADPVWQRLGPPCKGGREPCMLPYRH